jgi:hypothetical protein
MLDKKDRLVLANQYRILVALDATIGSSHARAPKSSSGRASLTTSQTTSRGKDAPVPHWHVERIRASSSCVRI